MPRWCDGGPPSCRMGVEAGGALGAEGACPSRSSLRGPLVSLGLLADPWEEIAIASCWPRRVRSSFSSGCPTTLGSSDLPDAHAHSRGAEDADRPLLSLPSLPPTPAHSPAF
ncbi:hypothetical protein CDAR_31581 [Caerostris darwini]|uniref:Uncharacterized protein n=1 Tax=Caerostris darwini TaxID=1538125 RepID=A0AAV4NR57_9ARAC|nr:hypothetical protein CDAR_31581 [Caerostris darwini]